VSLSVTVEQAQILTFAGDVGELTLILRNPDDIAILEELPETTARNILEIEERRALIRREPEQERPRIPENLGSQR
jgi:pilus assembly protein CpaB